MNNKGVELAINQVVIFIIAIVILGLGLVFMTKVFSVSNDKIPVATEQLEQELERALSSGSIVEIPKSTKYSSAKDMAIFNLGVRNDPAVADNNSFEVLISFSRAVNNGGQEICSSQECRIGALRDSLRIADFTYDGTNEAYYSTIDVPENDLRAVSWGVVPRGNDDYAGPGQYFYAACVCDGDCQILTCNSTEYSTEPNAYGYSTFSVIVR